MFTKKLLSLMVSGIALSSVTTQAAIYNNDNISVTDTWGIFNQGNNGMYLINNTVIDVSVTGDGAQSHGLLVNASPTETLGDTKTLVNDSTINSEGNGAYLVGGYTQFDNSKISASGKYGIVTKGGTVYLDNGSSIDAKNTALGIYMTKGYDGTYLVNEVTLDNSSVTTESTAALAVGLGATANIHVYNGSTIDSGNGVLLTSADDSVVSMDLDNSLAIGNITALGDSTLNVELSNKSFLYGSVKNVNNFDVNTTSEWDILGDSDLNNLVNAGTVNLSNGNNFGTILTIHNNYKGDNGTILFRSQLAGDNSPIDKLVIEGNSEGNTYVVVKNIGGKGAQTLDGIGLITVQGNSDGIFTQQGRIVAGAYDYNLIKKDKNWYLTSSATNPTPDVHINRPEGGSYIANLAAANTLFNTRLHDRLGETQYVDALTGARKVTSLWLRQVGSHNNSRDGSGQLKTQSNTYVAQLGGDVAQWSTDGLSRGHVGLMAGYGNNHNTTKSSLTNYNSKGSFNGYSVGAYGTWFANDTDKSGLYVDSWLQYSWFNNQVNGQQLTSESYKSKGFTASVETGYTIKMGEIAGSQGTLNEWFIQPQAQAIWMGVKADDHREENGTRVSSDGDGNVQTRLGMRAYMKFNHDVDNDENRIFEPFIEANWLHNTRNYSVKMDDSRINQDGADNIGEVKVGVEGQINPHLNLWGNVGNQIGDKGYHDTTATLGIKYNF